ncbi:hypothetical protein [Gorillibacterium sp. sgz5001074]|uniref:hypothetical protein n=1 Tax=Gorillibacterium sp. sgz5001074 TaxID=3446695 RepID=UPI003F66C8DC
MKYQTINYFLSIYRKEINAGGTFSNIDLLTLFFKNEPSRIINNLIEESRILLIDINNEDWEMSMKTKELCKEYGKNGLKKLVNEIVSVSDS